MRVIPNRQLVERIQRRTRNTGLRRRSNVPRCAFWRMHRIIDSKGLERKKDWSMKVRYANGWRTFYTHVGTLDADLPLVFRISQLLTALVNIDSPTCQSWGSHAERRIKKRVSLGFAFGSLGDLQALKFVNLRNTEQRLTNFLYNV